MWISHVEELLEEEPEWIDYYYRHNGEYILDVPIMEQEN